MRSHVWLKMRQWWSLLKPIRILQFNSNIPKPGSSIDVRCFMFLHINYSSDLKTLQVNGAASNNVFSSWSKYQGTHSPWVQHSYELIPVPDAALQYFPMQLVLIGDLLAISQGPYLTLLDSPTRSALRWSSGLGSHPAAPPLRALSCS